MKIVLACLMCVLLSASECFAISGGPVFNTSINVVGTYAGVIKIPHPNAPPSDIPDCAKNSLGVFSVGVPTTGIASGDFVMFSQGRIFTGTIRGTADPGRAKLIGVLNATFDFTVTIIGTDQTIDVTAEANGSLKTTISNVSSQAALGATTATRLTGTATLAINHGEVDFANEPIITCEMTLRVVGFKQSSVAPAAASGTSG
jgi:hypothetical protein